MLNFPREEYHAHDKKVRGNGVPLSDTSSAIKENSLPPIDKYKDKGGKDT